MISFDSEICADFAASSTREWIETNGIGGFASSTISGANTRRYHGLLTAATDPPLGRITMLSKFEETLSIDGKLYELSANQYRGTVHPKGYIYLKSFRIDPFPIWVYEIDGIEIERKIFMVHGENSTVCVWSLLSKVGGKDRSIELKIKPLLSFVDYHSLQHETAESIADCEISERLITVKPKANLPNLYFSHNAKDEAKTGFWYRNFEYQLEKERGFDFSEDLFQPFTLAFDMAENAVVSVSTTRKNCSEALQLEEAEKYRRAQLIEIAGADDHFTQQLVLAADQFIVSRGDGDTIIAGYPWFSDWGRDTMISLSGLTLSTNREGIAKNILHEYAKYISKGMIPNRFPDASDEPEYNTVDATLWYIEAIRAYLAKTEDYEFVRDTLYEGMVEIIYWHQRGTRFNIHLDEDGLLFAGEEGLQLTWMDAKYGDEVFTPRIGKAVEIQALWYNALRTMTELADKFGDQDGMHQYAEMAKQTKASFNRDFWNDEQDCLYDFIDRDIRDASVRPNQLFAVSLKHSMLSMFKAKKVVQKVESELFTPLGLRSLSPKDEKYRPIYAGSPHERDSAYHQGTVWAWLMGAFLTSVKRTYPKGRKSRQYVEKILDGFKTNLETAGVGQISEIFDGDEPHNPRGCFAQAWSVAEILRVLK